jgi:hypothetical protein
MRVMKAHDLFVVLAMMALASLVGAPMCAGAATAATPGSTTPADDSAQALAVYSGGGKITAPQAIAKAKDMTGPGRGLRTFDSPESMYETAARQLALRAILLAKATDLGLDKKPGWPVAEKLIESKALATLMMDTTWFSVTPTQQDIDKFAKDNPEMLRPPQEPKPGGASKVVGTAFAAPSQNDWLAWQARAERAFPLMDALGTESKTKYPPICADIKDWQKPADDAVLVRCGKIAFTAKEIQALSDLVSKPIEWCSQLYVIADGSEEILAQGELARDKDYGKRLEFAGALATERENWLAWIAKSRLFDEILAAYTPSEAEIKDYYDTKFTGEQDQIIKCDAIVCPTSGEGGRDKARATAAEIIMSIQQGGKFDDAVKQHPECRYMGQSTRYIRAGTSGGFDSPAISGVAAGGIALEPVEDYGGFCVIRVLDNSPKQKLPLQYSRGSCVEALRFDYRTKMASDVDGAILDKYGFAIQKEVLAQVSRTKGG